MVSSASSSVRLRGVFADLSSSKHFSFVKLRILFSIDIEPHIKPNFSKICQFYLYPRLSKNMSAPSLGTNSQPRYFLLPRSPLVQNYLQLKSSLEGVGNFWYLILKVTLNLIISIILKELTTHIVQIKYFRQIFLISL